MKKVAFTLIVFFAMFALSGNIAHCRSFEFSLNANTINVCPCKTAVVIANLKNLLPQSVDYSINSNLDWVTPLPQKFELSPYGEQNIYLYITPKCDIKPGEYLAKVSIYSYNAPEDDYITLPLTINVLPCNNFELKAPEKVEGCPGETQTVKVVVENTGVGNEALEVEMLNQTQKVELSKGENKTITFSVEIKNESYEAEIKAKLLNGYGEKEKTVKIIPLACGKINVVQINKIYQVCKDENKKVKIILANNGDVAEKLKIFPYGDCTAMNKEVVIEPGEEKSVTIVLNGNISEETGSCKIYVVGPDFSKSYNLSFVVTPCGNQISVVAIPNKIELCPNEKKTVIVAVKNLGGKKNVILSASAGELGKDKLNVGSNGEAMTYLKIKASNLRVGDNLIVISAFANGYKDNTTLHAILLPENICKGFAITPEEENINLVSPGEHKVVEIKITNMASSPEKYYIISKGASWIHVVPEELYLRPGETGYVYAYISPDYNVSKGIYQETIVISNGNNRRTSKIIVFYGINQSAKGKSVGMAKSTNAITTLVEVNNKQFRKALAEFVLAIILAGIIFVLLIGRDLLKDFSNLLNNKDKKDKSGGDEGEEQKEEKSKKKKKKEKRKEAVKEIEEIKKLLEKV